MVPATGAARQQKLKDIFNAARRTSRERRMEFLRQACGSDEQMLQEIELLLAARRPLRNNAAAFRGNERFELVRSLGRGGFGRVWLARDRVYDEDVALKILYRSESRALAGFKRELRILDGFAHPNVARCLEVIEPEKPDLPWLLRMEFVDGMLLDRFVLQTGSIPFEIVRQLAAGLHALHESGIIHRDIKPSNILVTLSREVKIVDFGLAQLKLRPGGTTHRSTAGTPQYMAPELLRGEMPSANSDWYAVGVLLSELLTGASSPAAEIRSSDPLREACTNLLALDPESRSTGAQILLRLGADETAPQNQPPGIPHRIEPRAPRFVGRKELVNRLWECFQATERHSGRPVHIYGPPGIGKTALAEHFLSGIRENRRDAQIFASRCYEGDSIRYKGLDDLVDGLWRYMDRLPASDFAAVIPRDFLLLTRLFPVLKGLQTKAGPRMENPLIEDPAELRRRAFGALRELLQRIAFREPLILFIDDLQWADMDSAEFLSSLTSNSGESGILLILAYRAEAIEIPGGPVVLCREDSALIDIEVDVLTETEAEELATGLLAGKSRLALLPAAERDPLHLTQLCWYVNSGPVGSLPDLNFEGIVAARISQMPDVARRFLRIVAIGGTPLALPVIRRAAEIENDISRERDLLIAQRLLRRAVTGDNLFDVYHDRIRGAVLRQVGEPELSRLHLRLAESVESIRPDQSEIAAHHFEKAGEFARAGHHFEIAAAKASDQLAFHAAARFYTKALELRPERADLERRLADTLVNAGNGEDAAHHYLALARQAVPDESQRLQILAAGQLLRAGHLEPGRKLLETLCRETGLPFPASHRERVLHWLAAKTRLRLRGLKPSRSRVLTENEINRLDVCWAAAVGFSVVEPFLSSIFIARFFSLALGSGDTKRLYRAFASEATQCAHNPRGEPRARRLLALARRYADAVGGPEPEAFVEAMTAVVDSMSGHWRECLGSAGRAAEIFREQCAGVAWEIGTATSFTFSSRWLLGRWDENSRLHAEAIREAARNKDRYSEATLRVVSGYHVACLAAADPARATQSLDRVAEIWRNPEYDVQRLYAFYCRVDIALYEGRVEDAGEFVREEWPLALRSGLLTVTLLKAFGLDLCGRVAVAEAHVSSGRGREEHLRAAEGFGVALRRLNAPYAVAQGAMVRACVAMSRKNRPLAERLLAEAEPVLERHGLAPWLSVARIRRGLLLGGKAGQDLWETGMEWMRAQCVERAIAPLIATFTPGDWN
jgi:serine/threonine protein kinase